MGKKATQKNFWSGCKNGKKIMLQNLLAIQSQRKVWPSWHISIQSSEKKLKKKFHDNNLWKTMFLTLFYIFDEIRNMLWRKKHYWCTLKNNIFSCFFFVFFSDFMAGKDDGSIFRAALLSGPPGVGKTTTATLVCQVSHINFYFIEYFRRISC